MLKIRHELGFLITCILVFMAFFITSCTSDDAVEIVSEAYQFKVPEFFPEPTYTFEKNPVTEAGFELGRKLFFDPILSRDQTIACSSCHSQSVAFADAQHRLSIGVEDRIGKRNAPSITNLAFKENFFWDGGVIHVDFIPVNAIENELEMDNNLATIIERLREDDQYPALFAKAFGKDTINSGRILYALSQFTLMMVSANSDYDKFLRGEDVQLSASALRGLEVFNQKCKNCHQGVLFTNNGFANNGLDDNFANDIGRALITEKEDDIGKFNIPSLRNVALTAPYMHDGRFSTLMEVLDHYQNGIKDSPSLSPLLRQENQLGISLTSEEKQDLITFLESLTDEEFIQDKRFFGSR